MRQPLPPVPEPFVTVMRQTLGADEAGKLIKSLDTDPVAAIRYNRRKTFPAGHPPHAGEVAWCPAAFRLSRRPVFALDPAWHQGRYYVQEPASMFAAYMAAEVVRREQGQPLRVVDLCAAPGGKTTAVADGLPDGSLMVANEFIGLRAEILNENLQKWGTPDTIVTRSDTSSLCAALEGSMDLAVADVPCSGEGMMRKEADARRQWSPALVAGCVETQRMIATNAANALRQGGWLIYSTCTFNADENEGNVEWICRELGFEVAELTVDPAWSILSPGAGYRFMPHRTGSEGLYMCLLRKVSDSRKARMRPAKEKTVRATGVDWADIPDMALRERDGLLTAISPQHLPTADALERATALLNCGTAVASAGKRGWEPTHSITMSALLRRGVLPETELDRSMALRYLARRTDALQPDGLKGFMLVTYSGMPLGLIKALGNRYNNLYPHNWRIRMDVE